MERLGWGGIPLTDAGSDSVADRQRWRLLKGFEEDTMKHVHKFRTPKIYRYNEMEC